MDNRHESPGASWPCPPAGVVPADPGMADNLARHLSPEHVRELRGVSGLAPATAIRLSLESSAEAYAFIPAGGGGEPLFMMGVEPSSALTGSAMVWMLGSAKAACRPAGVLRAARWGVSRAFPASGAARLEQYIPAWYRTGLRFIARLGFELSPTILRDRCGSPLWHAVLSRHGLVESGRTFRKGALWER